ncbi:dual specificty phosphatase [Sarcoptes scabiei]|nr:dual specificty phosphatase [Sarcoptes scabiei]
MSITSILIYLFLGYIAYSIYTIHSFLFPKECHSKSPDECLNPAFKSDDVFQLFLCTSISDHPLASKLDCFHHDASFRLAIPQNFNYEINLPFETINNGSLFLHAVLTKIMSARQLNANVIQSKHTIISVAFLTKYHSPTDTIFNLLRSESNERNDRSRNKKSDGRNRPITHWKSRMIINGLEAPFSLRKSALPFEILHLMQLDGKNRYMPIIHISEARQRIADIRPLPSKQPPLKMNLEIVYEPISLGHLRLTAIIEKAFISMRKIGFGDKEIEDAKGIFFETKPFFLLLTMLIVSFHVDITRSNH